MQRAIIIYICFILFTLSAKSQHLSGKILDSETGDPIEFAAVYINGTTIGTISDPEGKFLLEFSAFPDMIIVSHVNYSTKRVELSPTSIDSIEIKLETRFFGLDEVEVQGTSKREENLKYFKNIFLGYDSWGVSSSIINDSVLRFKVEYDTVVWFTAEFLRLISFEVQALAPLEISLPKLGYVMHYDLVNFSQEYDTTLKTSVLHAIGYRHFKAVEDLSSIKMNVIKRNRRKAYYFSPMHFTRSLYENSLAENGYRIIEWHDITMLTVDTTHLNLDSCNCMSYGDGEAHIHGLKDRSFELIYYGTQKGPLNIVTSKMFPKPRTSRLYFLNEECVIFEDGTRPGGSISFSGDIASKRIGANLPNNYDPNSSKKRSQSNSK